MVSPDVELQSPRDPLVVHAPPSTQIMGSAGYVIRAWDL
jgi:hypothetical protein